MVRGVGTVLLNDSSTLFCAISVSTCSTETPISLRDSLIEGILCKVILKAQQREVNKDPLQMCLIYAEAPNSPFFIIKAQVKSFFFCSVLSSLKAFGHASSVWMISASLLKLKPYLLSAWIDVAVSIRATKDIQWFSCGAMGASLMSHQLYLQSLTRVHCAAGRYLTPFISRPVGCALPSGQRTGRLLDMATLPSSHPSPNIYCPAWVPQPDKQAPRLTSDLLKKQLLRLLTLVGWTPRPATLQEILLGLTDARSFPRKELLNKLNYKRMG